MNNHVMDYDKKVDPDHGGGDNGGGSNDNSIKN